MQQIAISSAILLEVLLDCIVTSTIALLRRKSKKYPRPVRGYLRMSVTIDEYT